MYYALIYKNGSHPSVSGPFTSKEVRDSFIESLGRVTQAYYLETAKDKMTVSTINKKS